MSIERFLYTTGGALLGGGIGLFVGGPVGAAALASAGGSLGLSMCSSAASDKLKEVIVTNITDLVNGISHKCADGFLATTNNAVINLTNTTTNAIDTLVKQACMTTTTVGNTITTGLIGIGFYLAISNDLSGRCTTFPTGCYVLTVFESLVLAAVSIATAHNFYRASMAVGNIPLQATAAPASASTNALNLERGLNLIGKCKNPQCRFLNETIVFPQGFGNFMIGKQVASIICPECLSRLASNVNDAVMKDCNYSYKGRDEKFVERIGPLRFVEIKKLHFDGWRYLTIQTIERK